MQRIEQVYKTSGTTVVVVGKGHNSTVYFLKSKYYFDDDDFSKEKEVQIGVPAKSVITGDHCYHMKMSARMFSTIASIAKMERKFRI